MNIFEQILNAQIEQLENPVREVVNSEHSFVCERLRNSGFYEASTLYWKYVCGCGRIDDVEVVRLAEQLTKIDREQTMPSWGYSGT